VRRVVLVTVVALALGIAAIAVALSRSHSSSGSNSAEDASVATWPAASRKAPDFTLTDESGKKISLAALRGRSVLLTFIDPFCRDFCPREASVLTEAASQLEPAPVIVSVSVDPWADTAKNFTLDRIHWRLDANWHWATGSWNELAKVWKPYGVGVQVTRKKIAGVSVRYITHTGAAYLIDPHGFERALFLYPFTTNQVVDAARSLDGR
jgi:cytochrome oxidase Cu insertion factor (SCO1/SenC/PrrC family)